MKKVLFSVLMIVVPILLLLLLEGVARWVGVGAEGRDVFIQVPGKPTHQALNPAYVHRYFQGFAPSVAFHPFTVDKSPETFRVFVLGGSSTAGYPYHFYYSFSEHLRFCLQKVAPARAIEVVNLGMSAVNSYTLWDLRRAIVEAKPDAIVIYAGHNEYYGAFGVGSTVNAFAAGHAVKRLILRLKHSALYTALEQLLVRPPEQPVRQTMMARVVGDARITLDSEAYQAGLTQYERNMGDVLNTFADAGIPVFLGTVASNLKDQPPLGTEPRADAAYEQGLANWQAGQAEDARAAFLEAKELDGLRFRAPEAINEILRRFAASDRGMLVEVPTIADAGSKSGIADDGFFDDHLHPNAAGHAAIADAFFQAMQPQIPWLAEQPPDSVQAVMDPIESAYAQLQITVLEAGYPFNKTRSPAEVEAVTQRLLRGVQQRSVYDSLAVVMATEQQPPPQLLLAGLQYAKVFGDTTYALRLYRALLHWQPFNTRLLEEAVGYAIAAQGYEADATAIVAFAWSRTQALNYLQAWAALELRQRNLRTADRLLTLAEERDPNAPITLFNKARLLVLQGDTLAARTYFDRYQNVQGTR